MTKSGGCRTIPQNVYPALPAIAWSSSVVLPFSDQHEMTASPRHALPPSSCLLPFALGLIGCVVQAPVEALTSASTSAPAAAPVAPARMVAPAACSFGAFVQEDDPAGLDVHASPGLAGKIVGTLAPTFKSPGNERFHSRVEVDVSGGAGDWIHVANAHDNTTLTEREARPMFAGDGWVAGRKITVKSQATHGHAAPGVDSPAVMSLKSGDTFDGDEMVDAGHVIGCQGRWAQVEYAESALSTQARADLVVAPAARAGLPVGRFRAWVNKLCGVQETTCGASDDSK